MAGVMTQSNSWRRLRGGEGVGREGKKGVERVSKMKNCGNRVEWSFNSPLSPDSRKFDYSPGGLRGRLRENSKRQLCSLSYEFCTNLYAGKGFEEGGRGGGGMMNIDRSFSERIGSGAIYAAAGKIILLMVMNVLVKMC